MDRNVRFVILDIDGSSDPRDRAIPAVLSVPHDVTMPGETERKNLIIQAFNQKCSQRRWRWNRKIALSEEDAGFSPLVRSMFEGVDWGSVEPIWIIMPSDHLEAYDYVKQVGPSASAEGLIASDTTTSYKYAMDVLNGRFQQGEEAIAKDPVKSVNYANVAKCRIIPGEKGISEVEELAIHYGKLMKKYGLWGSWSEDDVARSPIWMYQYAKDYLKGSLPESLHNRMHLMSFSELDSNKWIKKYLGAKKYVLKRRGGS